MKNLLFVLFSIFMVAIGCSSIEEPSLNVSKHTQDSKYLSSSEAIDIAVNAFKDFQFEPTSRSSRTAFASIYRSSEASRSAIDSTFYVVNFMEGGFVLVNAERKSHTPVLAISDVGAFHDDDGNECLKEYLGRITMPLPDLPVDTFLGIVISPIDSVITYHDRFVPTLWGQFWPYNKYCPLLEDGNFAVTGCNAVAMGQNLAFHRRPDKINGYDLDWDEMLTSQKAYFVSQEGEDNIARLLRECGRLLNTSYGTTSTAKPKDVPDVMKSLGFKNAEIHHDLSKCIESLKVDGPVQMCGYTSNGGHMWIADGAKIVIRKYSSHYSTTTYYLRMNWGWEGASDGYYIVKEDYNSNNVLGYNEFGYVTGVN